MRFTRLLAPLLAAALALPGCNLDTSTTGTFDIGGATVETAKFDASLGIDPTSALWTKTPTGLYYRTLAPGTGTGMKATNGQRVTVRYTGYLPNGAPFESNVYTFTLGRGEVIAGWDQGILDMEVGERRLLLIPASLGYGTRGSGPIPPNAVLVFDVQVASIG
jgi:FKBP-type peptidyl-prolyl cis-trans isomerase FkpA